MASHWLTIRGPLKSNSPKRESCGCNTSGPPQPRREIKLPRNIHIATGFQLAGFPHIIRILWEANDLKAREVATEFYKNLFDSMDSGRGFDDETVAVALHKAVASLREKFKDNPILWAPFIHLGA